MILYDKSIPQFGNNNISECVLSRSLNIFGNIPLLRLYISIKLHICSVDKCHNLMCINK